MLIFTFSLQLFLEQGFGTAHGANLVCHTSFGAWRSALGSTVDYVTITD